MANQETKLGLNIATNNTRVSNVKTSFTKKSFDIRKTNGGIYNICKIKTTHTS